LDEVDKVYRHIDGNSAGHIENLRRLLMQPSVSQTGEGMTECAEMLKEWLSDLGCTNVELAEPEFHWPMVYGEYDAGAEKTLIAYGMYDVQPVEPELRARMTHCTFRWVAL
jgi:acetylornithine deacetylase/succinyl-diaminopimelate desuccinylase-like protein